MTSVPSRRMLSLFATLALVACSGPRALNTVAINPDHRTKISRDLAYGDQARQVLDVYRPAGDGPFPVLIFFHGGSWNTGSKGGYAFVGKRFASRGFLTIVANYRLAPDHPYPAFMEDAGAAVAWAYQESAGYGGDPSKLFVSGHSAGGYIAAQVALAPEFLAPAGLTPTIIDGVVGLAGPYDFWPSTIDDVIVAFGANSDPQQTMPVNRVSPTAPPMLLLQGGADKVVYAHNAKNLAAALRAAGVRAAEKTYPDADHAALVVALAFPKKRPVVDDMVAFFQSLPTERLDPAIGE